MPLKTKWTIENVTQKAKQFKKISVFHREANGAYQFAKRNGILDQITAHMILYEKKWTEEKVRKEIKRYKTVVDFRREAKGAYQFAKRNGILDQLIDGKERGGSREWSKQEVIEEAKKYSNISSFSKGASGAYKFAMRNGLREEISLHMKVLWEKKWDYESVKKEALKYKTKVEFSKNATGAYQKMLKENWNNLCNHMQSGGIKWTKEKIYIEARKYKTRNNFRKNSGGAYNAASQQNILDKVCEHMEIIKGKWVLETVSEEAKKYTYRSEFARGTPGAYNVAKMNGWLDKICKHMPEFKIKWTLENLISESQKYSTRKEFRDNSGGAYRAALDRDLLEEICEHMPQSRLIKIKNNEKELEQKDSKISKSNLSLKPISNYRVRPLWTKEKVLNIARLYTTKKDFRLNSYSAYDWGRRSEYWDEITSHMKVLWEKKWDYESVKKEALKYKTKVEFCKNATGAYQKMYLEGWIELSDHMVDARILNAKWNRQIVFQEAKKYMSRSEFAKNAPSAYKLAHENGWFSEACSHMKVLHNGYFHCSYVIINKRLKKVYVGITCQQFHFRVEQHKSKDNPCKSKEISNLCDTEFKQLTDYIYTPNEVRDFVELDLYERFSLEGYTVLNTKRALGAVGYTRRIWTKEKCFEEAQKYEFRSDFQKYSPNSYAASKRHGWLNDICSHMKVRNRIFGESKNKKDKSKFKEDKFKISKSSNRKWTLEMCADEAWNFDSIWEYQKYSSSYYSAKNNGWLDVVCAHMDHLKRDFDIDLILEEVKKYTYIKDLRTKDSYLYKLIQKKGLQEKAFAHLQEVPIWRKSNCNIPIWSKADLIYQDWIKTGDSFYIISKRMGFNSHRCSAIVHKFQDGWKPLEDEDWVSWKNEVFARKKKNLIPQNLEPFWRKKFANKVVWRQAGEVYKVWYSSNDGDTTIAKKMGVEGRPFRLIVEKFRSGWIPQEDSDWVNWVENIKMKGN